MLLYPLDHLVTLFLGNFLLLNLYLCKRPPLSFVFYSTSIFILTSDLLLASLFHLRKSLLRNSLPLFFFSRWIYSHSWPFKGYFWVPYPFLPYPCFYCWFLKEVFSSLIPFPLYYIPMISFSSLLSLTYPPYTWDKSDPPFLAFCCDIMFVQASNGSYFLIGISNLNKSLPQNGILMGPNWNIFC